MESASGSAYFFLLFFSLFVGINVCYEVESTRQMPGPFISECEPYSRIQFQLVSFLDQEVFVFLGLLIAYM